MRRFRRHTRNTLRGVNKNRIYGKTRQNSLKDTAIRIKKEKRAKAPASVGGYAKCRRVCVQFCLFSAKKYKKNRKREQLLLIIIYFVLSCIILVIIIRIYIPIHMNLFSYEWVYKSYCSITANKHPCPVPRNTKICDNLLVTVPEDETEKLLVIAEFLLASVTTAAVEPFLLIDELES